MYDSDEEKGGRWQYLRETNGWSRPEICIRVGGVKDRTYDDKGKGN